MLISCPGCKANFNFDETKIDTQGVKLRCFRCKSIFKIIRKQRAAKGRVLASVSDRPRQIVKFVVAHESPSFCEAVMRVVANEPFLVYDSNDGAEAMAIIEKVKPDVVLLDVALPTMYGFEICEAMHNNPSLAHTKIILLAAIYDKRRYRRNPASMYGADDVIEKHRIPEELVSHIYTLIESVPDELRLQTADYSAGAEPSVANEQDWLAPALSPADVANQDAVVEQSLAVAPPVLPVQHAATSGEIAIDRGSHDVVAEAAADAVPVVEVSLDVEHSAEELAQSFVAEVVVEDGAGTVPPAVSGIMAQEDLPEGHVKARRLARIIVSDIALYNPEKVEHGIKEGTIQTLLADEYAEGQALYTQRIAAEIREATNYLEVAWQQLIDKKKREYGV